MKISVIIPTYNGHSKGYLDKALQSVLTQSVLPYEIIVINDGSTDTTTEFLLSLAKTTPLIHIYNQENKGLSNARNTGIQKSKGDFVCFLDDDDIWDINKVKLTKSYYEKTKCPFLFCNITLIDNEGMVIGEQTTTPEKAKNTNLLLGNYINSPSGVTISKDLINKIGYFDECLKSSEDYDYWIRASKYSKPFLIPENLVKYRLHSQNMSKNIYKMEFFNFYVILKHLNFKPPSAQVSIEFYKKFLRKYKNNKDWLHTIRCLLLLILHLINYKTRKQTRNDSNTYI